MKKENLPQSQYNPQKLLLVDCDGVLLSWEWAFNIWMQQHGFEEDVDSKLSYDMSIRYGTTNEQITELIRIFNESDAIGYLPPLRDAVYYVKRLYEEHGYQFHCITSLSQDVNAQRLREMNLKKLFGDNTFEKFVFLDTCADKDAALEPYRDSGCYWVEDKTQNADLGYNMGLRSVLMIHGYNMNHECPYPKVKNWCEAYKLITGQTA